MRTMAPDGLDVANATVEKWEEETIALESTYAKYDEAEMREICGDADPIAFLDKQVPVLVPWVYYQVRSRISRT